MPTVTELLDKKHKLYLQLKAQNQKLFDLYQEYEKKKTDFASLQREYEALDRELFAAKARADAVSSLAAKYSLEQLEAEAQRRGLKL